MASDFEAGFLKIAGTGNKDSGLDASKNKEPGGIWKDAAAMKNLYEHEEKNKAKAPAAAKAGPPQMTKAEDEERVNLIKRYNDYCRNAIIARRLGKGNYQGPKYLPIDKTTLGTIKGCWVELNQAMSDGESRTLAYNLVGMVNNAAEKYQPLLAEEPSLTQVFQKECSDEDSHMCLSMEELSIYLAPYTPQGMITRFAYAYGTMVNKMFDYKKQVREEEINTKVNTDDMEERYKGL